LGGMPTQQVPLAVASTNESASTAGEQEVAPTSHALAAALRTFGEVEWKQYFGDVGSAPDLPSHIAAILDGPCPFWPHKKVRDTHLLVLIPATVDGVPLTLNRLGELIKHPSHGGHRTEYRYYNERIKVQIGKESPPHSYWVLLTRDVLPGSRNTGYADQKALVANYARRKSVPYALPSVLEAATAIFMHHALEGERLFGDDPWTYTRCPAGMDDRDPAVVGGFGSSGLFVSVSSYDFCTHGVACCRKF
jgi:NLR family CARD domain-containing protein 3